MRWEQANQCWHVLGPVTGWLASVMLQLNDAFGMVALLIQACSQTLQGPVCVGL